jgi:hypothetical protein
LASSRSQLAPAPARACEYPVAGERTASAALAVLLFFCGESSVKTYPSLLD